MVEETGIGGDAINGTRKGLGESERNEDSKKQEESQEEMGEEEEEEEEDGGEEGDGDSTAGDEEGEVDGAAPSTSAHTMIGGSIVGDVLYSIATGEEEGKSRARILAFAAKRYQTAVEKNPKDYDALYNWALVLQESADNCGPDAGLHGKDALLEDACAKYQFATDLCPTLHEAFYNWAIAISDRAKIRGRTLEAEDLWKKACEKYERAVQLNWDSPQALNNWGLALQELGTIVPIKEKRAVVKKAINKFRAAIRLRFDFHRAIYNLGTVLYGLAEDMMKGEKRTDGKERPANDVYSQSAVYIAAAHALKSDYPVYRNALRLVRTMLPLPYLKGGYLTVPPHGNSLAPHSEWIRRWFVLSHECLQESKKPEPKSSTFSSRRGSASPATPTAESDARSSGASVASSGFQRRLSSGTGFADMAEGSPAPTLKIDVLKILSVEGCTDLSLPPGGGLMMETSDGPVFMVADDWEAMDGWIDAIRLVYTIYVRGKSEELASVLAG